MTTCKTCAQFPSPTSQFEEIGTNNERHGTLYRCKDCGRHIELVAEERSVRVLTEHEVQTNYSERQQSE
jgi:RNase P subunit RPR2